MPTILITGANRGIGLEFVKQYAADKWNVIACCRAPQKADALQILAKNKPAIRIEALEVTDSNSIVTLATTLKDSAIDILLNNAGIFSGGSQPASAVTGDKTQTFGTIDADAWAKVLRVNTIAPLMMAEAFVPHLKKGVERKIINITSRMGSLTEMGSGSIAYRSSKAALNGAMRVAMHDLQKSGISIYNLHPGWVQTDMGGSGAHLKPEQSVTAMHKTIAGLKPSQSGSYLNYDGQIIQW
jgi:NAD(P)-dependent dehydrogenase (short-subunit alcohol dehydrogenase family)